MNLLSTLVRTGDARRLEIRSTTLVVTVGPDAGVEHELAGQAVVLGRGEEADLVLADPTVSREHARLEPEEDGWRIRDLGSAAGVEVDGVGVEVGRVRPGQRIRLGDTEVVLEGVTRRVPVPDHAGPEFEGLLGESPAMAELFGIAARVAPLDLPVLLRGEPGTGKEGLAFALHEAGRHARGPYEVVDCTLLASGEHLRSELFGHVAGAFSGATESREGAFARANGGTIFLDEIGELPAELQPQLLRVLQEGEVRPLGGDEPTRVRVRVISATNRDLPAMVRAGTFRADLYQRLAAVVLEVPPLRERGEDLLLLAEAFLPPGTTLEDDAVELLRSHGWPGNVRELSHALRAAAALADGGRVRAGDIRLAPEVGEAAAGPDVAALAGSRKRVRDIPDARILEALAKAGGNRAAAARLLGIGRSTFFRRLKEIRGGDEG